MKARDIMSSPVVAIRDDATLEDAAAVMTDRRVGGLPVVDEGGKVVGFLTEGDFVAHERGVPFSLVRAPQVLGQWLGKDGIERIYERSRRFKVRDVMSKPAVGVPEDASLEKVVLTMMQHDIKRVVVVREKKPVGIVTRHDLLRLLVPSPRPR